MIIFFGPAGAGKSVQGQILAARHGWRWLSIGQLLRDTRDIDLIKIMHDGKLVPSEKANEIVESALRKARGISKVIIDGYPRQLDQARWLVEKGHLHGRSIDLVIVLELPVEEVLKRLELRGRADDNVESIKKRIDIYDEEINPILEYFSNHDIKVAHINGVGTVGQVHDRIMEELEKSKLV